MKKPDRGAGLRYNMISHRLGLNLWSAKVLHLNSKLLCHMLNIAPGPSPPHWKRFQNYGVSLSSLCLQEEAGEGRQRESFSNKLIKSCHKHKTLHYSHPICLKSTKRTGDKIHSASSQVPEKHWGAGAWGLLKSRKEREVSTDTGYLSVVLQMVEGVWQ